MPDIQFRLDEFKKAGAWLDARLPFPLSFTIKYLLSRLEARVWASYRVEEGILPITPPDPVVEPPRYLSEPSEVKGLDTIELKAPWTSKK